MLNIPLNLTLTIALTLLLSILFNTVQEFGTAVYGLFVIVLGLRVDLLGTSSGRCRVYSSPERG